MWLKACRFFYFIWVCIWRFNSVVDVRMTARFDDRLRTSSTESCDSLESEQKEKKGKDEVTSRLFAFLQYYLFYLEA